MVFHLQTVTHMTICVCTRNIWLLRCVCGEGGYLPLLLPGKTVYLVPQASKMSWEFEVDFGVSARDSVWYHPLNTCHFLLERST